MINLVYSDFDEVYFGVNKSIIQVPEMLTYMRSTQGFIEDLVIDVKSIKTTKINLGELGYHKRKWDHLLGVYLDIPKLEKFYKELEKSRGLSMAFDFNRKDSHNGSCLREIIFTRPNQNKPWTGVKIIWRATELQRRFAADLILLSKILHHAPYCELKNITFYMAQAYQSAMYVVPLLKPQFGFDVKKFKDSDNRYISTIYKRWLNYYQADSPPQKMSCNLKMQILHQDILKGKKFDKLTYNTLEIPFTNKTK